MGFTWDNIRAKDRYYYFYAVISIKKRVDLPQYCPVFNLLNASLNFLPSFQRVIVLDNEKIALAVNNHTPYKGESYASISIKRGAKVKSSDIKINVYKFFRDWFK